ncbi:hypothetical protein QR680_000388 [Steinernema hermaphroditum]|uniref:BTB domain-containing protein n=1 Tax=Steinernema hermaphroditum TaxID=289476 RepID=A0AA39LDI0_9BILA|nr:hypothetical protein QR680_000388 [Steinernema hermaphroditum]
MDPSGGGGEGSIESSTTSGGGGTNHHFINASETEIRVEHISRNWTVRNFSHCYQEYLENFVHLPRGEETLTWSIKIYPKGNGENNKEFVFLCLNRVLNVPGAPQNSMNNKNKIGFKSKFVLRNSDNKEIDMRIHPNPSHSDYVSYIKRDILFPQIMPADSIIVTVEIAAAVDTITTTLDEPFKTVEFEKALGDDYLTLLNDDVLTDFTIRVGDRDIHTHKAILAARSPVFAAMFTHSDTKEAKMGVLVIEDLDYEVVKDMLMYIYSGKCSGRSDWAPELLIAADKYRLDELKRHCESAMIRELTCDNQRSADFMKLHLTAITKTSGWEELINRHPSLVTSIVRYVDNRKTNSCDDVSNSHVL